ncbi:MAG: hypothetical protein RL708_2262 [Bacteroidota bacterium]|jgi:hypothetical protein
MKLIKKKIFFAFILLFNSCTTYHLSTQSLVQQLANTNKEKKVTLFIALPFFFPFIVNGNDLKEIKVLDKNGMEHTIPVTNHTGIRITRNDSTRTTFYFNTLMVKDSFITGKKDHFLGINIKPINLNNISKIELQK